MDIRRKRSIGKYAKVKAITLVQAKSLAKELFYEGFKVNKLWAEGYKLRAEGDKLRAEGDKLWAEGDKLRAEGDKLWTEGYKLWAEGDKLRAEGYKLWAEGYKLRAEGDKLRAEGDKLWAEVAIKHRAFIPDPRALSFIAKDRKDSVYCFMPEREEIWVYDGEGCPNPETVEKIILKMD